MPKQHQKRLLNTLLCQLIGCDNLDVFAAIGYIAVMYLDDDYKSQFWDDHNVQRLNKE